MNFLGRWLAYCQPESKEHFWQRMQEQAEANRLFQEGRSAAWKLWGENMRRKRAQEEAGIMKVELIKAEYVARLEQELATATTYIESLEYKLATCRAEMETLRQEAGLAANEVGSPDRARISGLPVAPE